MNRWTYPAAISAALLAGLVVLAQDPQAAPEPEFLGVPYRLDAGNLVELERQPVHWDYKGGGFMKVSGKSRSEFPGAHSPVRISAGNVDFVVRWSPQADPRSAFSIHKLTTTKKTREMLLVLISASPFGAHTKTPDDTVPYTAVRYGANSMKLTVPSLSRGEYAISAATQLAAFCFGVD